MSWKKTIKQLQELGLEPFEFLNPLVNNENMLNSETGGYFKNCITDEGYSASGIYIFGKQTLVEENRPGVSPGGRIIKYGFIAVASSLGGNAIVLSENGEVYWADHSYFSIDREINFEDKDTGEWQYVAWNKQGVLNALHFLSKSVEQFWEELLLNRWTERLDELD